MGAVKNSIIEICELYRDGYSTKEIAEKCGYSESYVRSAIRTFIEYGMEL